MIVGFFRDPNQNNNTVGLVERRREQSANEMRG